MVCAEMDADLTDGGGQFFRGARLVACSKRNLGHAGAQVDLVGIIGRRSGARLGQHLAIGDESSFGLPGIGEDIAEVCAHVAPYRRISQQGAGLGDLFGHIAGCLRIAEEDEAVGFRFGGAGGHQAKKANADQL